MPTTHEYLVRTGYRPEQATELLALSPLERMRKMEIVGNHWSDSPIFDAAHEVLTSADTTLDEKAEAIVKLCHTTGTTIPPLETERQKTTAVGLYLKNA